MGGGGIGFACTHILALNILEFWAVFMGAILDRLKSKNGVPKTSLLSLFLLYNPEILSSPGQAGKFQFEVKCGDERDVTPYKFMQYEKPPKVPLPRTRTQI